ncbi:MAG: DinB family protein [Flavobacteriales bacterium]
MSKSYNRGDLIKRCNAQIQEQLLEVTTLFSSVNEDLLITSPLPVKWSAKQCLEHLNLTIQLYLPRIKVALKSAEPSSTLVLKRGIVGSFMINSLRKSNVSSNKPRAMKTFKQLQPGVTGKSSIAVVIEFSEALNELYTCLNESQNKNIDELKITSAAGPILKLRLSDVFPFLLEHNQRHINQATRAVELCKKH